jgi:hypothetical protein
MDVEVSAFSIDVNGLTWFTEHEDKDLCSLCLDVFGEEETPIMLFAKDGKTLIRLHYDCFIRRAIKK